MTLSIDFVTETYPPEINGVAMTVSRLVRGLRERGHRVGVIRPAQNGNDLGRTHELVVSGIPIPGYPGLRLGLPAGARLAKRWRADRPDLVHVVTEGPLGWSAVNTARRLGIPVTSGFHTNFDRYSIHYGLGWMRPAVAAYLRSLHRRTLATMVPTEALAADLAGEGLAGVRVVGRGVDTGLFDPALRSDHLRATWGVTKDAPVCLYVGRLAPEKNLATVVRTFAAVRQRQADAKLVWVGDGPSAAALASAHPEHHFAGTRQGEDLAAHYASADLFIFPSLTETYGNVVAEAMASGLPVVAYRSAAAAELITPRETGALATPGDEAAFIEAALWMLEDKNRRQQLASAARASILGRNWPAVVERFEDVAREAMGHTVLSRQRAGSAGFPPARETGA